MKIKFSLSFLCVLLICVIVLSGKLIQFSQVETILEINPSVTINGKSFDEVIENSIEIVAGHTKYYNIEIINHCNKSINITVSHIKKDKKVKIDVYILYNNSIMDLPFTLENNTKYNAKIVYETNHTVKPNTYLITSEFYFAD